MSGEASWDDLSDWAERPGFVYLATCGEFIKIGYSVNPASRIRSLDSGPIRVVLQLAFRADWATEAALHYEFRTLKHRGEWHRLDIEEDPRLGQLLALTPERAEECCRRLRDRWLARGRPRPEGRPYISLHSGRYREAS